VTTTSTGADAVTAWFEWWNAVWGYEAEIVNATGALAAVNLAGPQARDALGRLVEDPDDVAADAFKYLDATHLEVAGEAFDVGPAGAEQADVVLGAPGDELAQVKGIGLTGQASISGEERRQCVPLGGGERQVDHRDVGGRSCIRHVAPPGQAETWRPEPPGPSCTLKTPT